MQNLLPLLVLLACPVAMGLMMLFMGRGMRSNKDEKPPGSDVPSLAELKAEQARLHEQIEHLEDRQRLHADRVPSAGR